MNLQLQEDDMSEVSKTARSKSKNNATSHVEEATFSWVFGDVLYAVLPIPVILALYLSVGRTLSEFLLRPEWSFAAIICFGVSLRDFIELKVRRQRDLSFRLIIGPQMYIVLLIASVLTLALVELQDLQQSMHTTLKFNARVLMAWQLSLFFIGVSSLYVASLAKTKHVYDMRDFPETLSPKHHLSYIEQNLEECVASITAAFSGLQKRPELLLPGPTEDTLVLNLQKFSIDRIQLLLQETSQAASECQRLLENSFRERSSDVRSPNTLD